MKTEVHRQACCAQDEQMGPLARTFELPERCSLEDLVNAVVASRFLQYSSTHTALHCRIAGKEVAVVFSPYEVPVREPLFAVASDTAVQDIASANREVDFVLDRTWSRGVGQDANIQHGARFMFFSFHYRQWTSSLRTPSAAITGVRSRPARSVDASIASRHSRQRKSWNGLI